MGWLSDLLLGNDSTLTFDQDVELLVARWTNRARKGPETMTVNEVIDALRHKIYQLEHPQR